MPRRDWNTSAAHSQKPRHKAMHSGARGKGGDRKLKAVKRDAAPHWGPDKHRRDRKPAEPDQAVSPYPNLLLRRTRVVR